QDCPEVLDIKKVIRETEARAAAAACGVPPERLIFMNLRFYRTGTIAKAPIHPQDIRDVIELIQRLQPAQIYLAGELSDPHGTHRVGAEAVFQAIRELGGPSQQARARSPGSASSLTPDSCSPAPGFEVWLYRGAWEEWEPHDLERVVPLSPSDLE